MGRDRRLIDSAGNEAKATTSGNRLQVRTDFESTNDLDDIDTVLENIQTLLEGTAKVKIWDGTDTLLVDASGQIAISNAFALETTMQTIDGVLDNIQTLLEGTQKTKIWDGTNEMPTMDAAARAGFQKVTDGTDVLELISQGQSYAAADRGILVMGRRETSTQYRAIPTAYYTDPVADKGTFAVPVTPMTGGREEGTFTRGFIPELQLNNSAGSTSVANVTWTTLATYTVPAGKTYRMTDFFAEPDTDVAGIEFRWQVTVGGVAKLRGRIPAGTGLSHAIHTPLNVAAGTTINLQVRQFSGGNVDFVGNIQGFETVDSELD